MREPDPPRRRGRGGARAGVRGAGGRRPPASPIHSAEPGGRGAPRPALHGGSAGAAPQPERRARPGQGATSPLPSARASRCPRATMSDPAVNAQLDGIISDFEGVCGVGCGGAQRPLGRGRCAKGEVGPPMGRSRAARPASPTWRTAAASFLPFIVVRLCRARTASSRAPGASSELPGAQFPSQRSLSPLPPALPVGPRAPQPCGGSGSWFLTAASCRGAQPPPPHQFRGWG